MKTIERHVSPDGQLVLAISLDEQGEVCLGFEGGEWHTHTDLIAHWLGVTEDKAFDHCIDRVKSDAIPVLTSTDGGRTFDPWISDNIQETVRIFGSENCVFRYWSGTAGMRIAALLPEHR